MVEDLLSLHEGKGHIKWKAAKTCTFSDVILCMEKEDWLFRFIVVHASPTQHLIVIGIHI